MNNNEANIVLTVMCDGEVIETIKTTAGKRLREILFDRKIYASWPCGGRGTCGKCKIKINLGRLALESPDGTNTKYVMANEEALACQSFLVENCVLDIGQLRENKFSGVLDFEISATDPIDTGYEIIRFVMEPQCRKDGKSLTASVNKQLRKDLIFRQKALQQLSVWFADSLKWNFPSQGADLSAFLTIQGGEVVQIRTDESEPIYGIGIDIGTTTVAFVLVDLKTGCVINAVSVLNSQRQFGSDVITRIQKASEGKLRALRESIRDDISREIINLCDSEVARVIRVVISGNTTMIHLLLGLRADSIAQSPFNAITNEAMNISAAGLFGSVLDCEVVLLPSASSYIGADIVSGMMYCRMQKDEGVTMLLDVGTNGEIVIRDKERILCTSTAAGPAFEGANISWGIGSVPGAISKIEMTEGTYQYRTIGNKPAIGICGSAVVDIVATSLRAGIIDRTGRFKSEAQAKSGLHIALNPSREWINFSQKDIREFQLAKSAVRSGIEIMIREFGCRWEEIERVYLAGGFGSRIDVDSAIEVGLFPVEMREKIHPVGNSSLGGTVHYLLYEKSRRSVDEIVRLATVIDLSKHPDFNDLFIQQLNF